MKEKKGKGRNEKRMRKKLLSWCIVLSMILTAIVVTTVHEPISVKARDANGGKTVDLVFVLDKSSSSNIACQKGPQSDLKVTVKTDKENYSWKEPVNITISVTNIGDKDLTVTFPTTQEADYSITNNGGEEVYRWAKHEAFCQVLTPVTVPVNKNVVLLSDYWDQTDDEGNYVSKGKYRIDGWMISYWYGGTIYPKINGNSVNITISGKPEIQITKPKEGTIYLLGREFISFPWTIIIGKITVEAVSEEAEVNRMEFYLGDNLEYTDYEKPYEWLWDPISFGKHTLKVTACGNESTSSDEIEVFAITL